MKSIFLLSFVKLLILINFCNCRDYDYPGYCIFEVDPFNQIPICPNYLFPIGEITIHQYLSNPEHKFTYCQNTYTYQLDSLDESFACWYSDGSDCTPEFFNNGNYTGNPDLCDSNSCTINSNCFCYPNTLYEVTSCLSSFSSNTASVYEPYHVANFSINYEAIVPLLTELFVNHPSIIVKFKDRGFQFISNELKDYLFRITTPTSTIHLNLHQRSFFEFTFPENFDHQAFTYRLEVLNDNTTYYSGINETKTHNFCDDPDCVFCQKAYKHFNCLSTERKVLFLICFLFISFLLILILAIILYAFFSYRKNLSKATKTVYTTVSTVPIVTYPSSLCKKMWCKFKSCFTPDTTKIYQEDSENNYNTSSFSDYLKEKYQVPQSLLDSPNAKTSISSYLIQKHSKSLTSVKKTYRVAYPQGVIPMFLTLSMIISFALCCNTGVTVNAIINNCVTINSTHEECNSQFSTSVSIDRIFNLYCATLTSNNVPFGSLRVGYVGARTKLNYNLLYYSSLWRPVKQSNYRCPRARGSYCEPQYCLSVNRTAFGNLDDYLLPLTYGQTYCDPVSSSGSNCFFYEDACLYSAWGVVPEPNSVQSVYRYSNYNPVDVDLFIEVATDTITSSNLITLQNSQVMVLDETYGFPGTTEISLDLSPVFSPSDQLSKVSYPSGYSGSSINDLGTFLPNKIGDIQSNSPATFTDQNYYHNLVTQPSAILSSKQIVNHGVDFNFFTSGLAYPPNNINKLPLSISDVDYSLVDTGSNHYSNFNGVNANLTNPGPIIVSFISQFAFTRMLAPCTFEIEILDVQGCCSCDTNAYLDISISYDNNHCQINYFSRDVDLLTLTNVYQDRIYFKTNDCSQNIHILAESSGFSVNLEYYISLEEPVIQSFSDGITTIEQYETSYDIKGTSFDVIHAPNFLKDFFNKDNMFRNVFLVIFFVLLGLCLFYFLYKCIISIACSMNPYKKLV